MRVTVPRAAYCSGVAVWTVPRMVLPRTTVPASYAALTASRVTPGKRAARPTNGERAVWDWTGPTASSIPETSVGRSGNWRASASPARSSHVYATPPR